MQNCLIDIYSYDEVTKSLTPSVLKMRKVKTQRLIYLNYLQFLTCLSVWLSWSFCIWKETRPIICSLKFINKLIDPRPTDFFILIVDKQWSWTLFEENSKMRLTTWNWKVRLHVGWKQWPRHKKCDSVSQRVIERVMWR